MLVGAAAGALAGALAFGAALAFSPDFGRGELGWVPAVAGVGAILGAALGPALAWGLLRRVPLGLAVGGPTAAAAAGGVLGWFVPAVSPVYGAVAGFALAGVALRAYGARRPAPGAGASGAA